MPYKLNFIHFIGLFSSILKITRFNNSFDSFLNYSNHCPKAIMRLMDNRGY